MPDEANANTPVGGATAPATTTSAPTTEPVSEAAIAALIGGDIEETTQSGQRQVTKPAAPAATPAPKPAATTAQPATSKSPFERVGNRQAAEPRKFDGLTPEETEIFKKMSNDAYNYLYPKFIEQKNGGSPDITAKMTQLEKDLAEARNYRYADHEEGYTLTPEYRDVQEQASLAENIANHWQNQLAAVQGGAKEVEMLVQTDTGIGVRKVPVTPQIQADLIRRIGIANNDVQSIRSQIEQLKVQHSSRHGGFNKALEGIYSEHFGPHEKILKKDLDEALSRMPKWFQHRPEAKLLAAALASNQYFAGIIESLQGQGAANKLLEGAAKSGGPTQGELRQEVGKPANGSLTYSEEEYNRVRSFM